MYSLSRRAPTAGSKKLFGSPKKLRRFNTSSSGSGSTGFPRLSRGRLDSPAPLSDCGVDGLSGLTSADFRSPGLTSPDLVSLGLASLGLESPDFESGGLFSPGPGGVDDFGAGGEELVESDPVWLGLVWPGLVDPPGLLCGGAEDGALFAAGVS